MSNVSPSQRPRLYVATTDYYDDLAATKPVQGSRLHHERGMGEKCAEGIAWVAVGALVLLTLWALGRAILQARGVL